MQIGTWMRTLRSGCNAALSKEVNEQQGLATIVGALVSESLLALL